MWGPSKANRAKGQAVSTHKLGVDLGHRQGSDEMDGCRGRSCLSMKSWLTGQQLAPQSVQWNQEQEERNKVDDRHFIPFNKQRLGSSGHKTGSKGCGGDLGCPAESYSNLQL